MPNDCINSFVITNVTNEQWQKIANTFQDGDDDEQHSFLGTFYPEPDYSVTPVARMIYVQDLITEEDPDRILKNVPTIREDSWWDWRVQNWGTKWDIYSCCNDWENEEPSTVFSTNFCTAWAPLSEGCMAVLSRQFPGSLLTNYYEESGMDFFGVTIAKDGVVRDFSDSMSKYREPFVRKQFPDLDARLEAEGLDLEDDLDEFFWDNCDQGEFTDSIFNSLDSLVEKMVQEIEQATAKCFVAA